MNIDRDRPRIRTLDAFPFTGREGIPLVCLRDPLRISPHVLGVSPDVAYALQWMDGAHTLDDIQANYQKRFQREIPADRLLEVVRMLDQAHFLDNEAFRGHYQSMVDTFRSAEIREAYHAGVSYPLELVGLSEGLSEAFSGTKGPGLPGPADDGKIVRGIIAPHIDLRIGGSVYAWAYRQLAESRRPDLIVILGTAHHGLRNLFALSRKRFATPLGVLSTDGALVDRLAAGVGIDLFSDEFAHRSEHTIEFQLLFVQLLFGGSVPIVPILTSFSHEMVHHGESAELIHRFLNVLQESIRRDGRRICLVASADLSHVGPRYGDADGFSGEDLSRVKEEDREMLAWAERVDGEAFVRYIAAESDRRRICGTSPIYSLLKVIDAKKGTLLAHDHGEMDSLGSICSYASLIFE